MLDSHAIYVGLFVELLFGNYRSEAMKITEDGKGLSANVTAQLGQSY